MSDLQKYIEKQMEDPEFRIEHEATKAELEKMRKAYQELQYYRKSSLIDRDNKSELAEALEDKLKPNKETLDAFAEVNEMKKTGAGQRFNNLDELWVGLEK